MKLTTQIHFRDWVTAILKTYPPFNSPNKEAPFTHSVRGPFSTVQVSWAAIPGSACSTRQYTRQPGYP